MKLKKSMAKLMCASLILGNFTIASASNVIIDESPISETDASTSAADTGWTTDESNLSDVEVTYQQSSNYVVTIPKTITLDSKKRATYSIKVTGDVDVSQRVYVAPVDAISDTEEVDFYMKDQNSKKDDVIATVTQNKIYWSSEEVSNGYEETNNSISAPDLTSGTWKGTFQVEIKLQSEKSHEHNFIDGKCECGEIDPNHEHNFVNGTCTICGEKVHEHNYIDGKCECGEIDPNHTHNFVNGTCTICNQQQAAGLYDVNGVMIASWETSGINDTCSNARVVITNTYPKTKKVIIPETVTTIGNSAFKDCALTEIIIPKSVTTIGNSPFYGCTLLKEIIIPESVATIDNWAFYGCKSLSKISLPNSLISIGNSVFRECASLETITIPDSVKNIGEGTFMDCTSLTQIVLPESVTVIENSLFNGCSSLENIKIGNSVTTIGAHAFYQCTSLADIVIPSSVVTIGDSMAFENVPHITYTGTATGSPWGAKSIN